MIAFGIGSPLRLLESPDKELSFRYLLAWLGLRSLKIERHAGPVQKAPGDAARALVRGDVPECSLGQVCTGSPHQLLNVNRGEEPEVPPRVATWSKSKR